jgi:glycerol kinase
MQFQADILQTQIERPLFTETTALGAAFLAGYGANIWNLDEIRNLQEQKVVFSPKMDASVAMKKYVLWQKAINCAKAWDG